MELTRVSLVLKGIVVTSGVLFQTLLQQELFTSNAWILEVNVLHHLLWSLCFKSDSLFVILFFLWDLRSRRSCYFHVGLLPPVVLGEIVISIVFFAALEDVIVVITSHPWSWSLSVEHRLFLVEVWMSRTPLVAFHWVQCFLVLRSALLRRLMLLGAILVVPFYCLYHFR